MCSSIIVFTKRKISVKPRSSVWCRPNADYKCARYWKQYAYHMTKSFRIWTITWVVQRNGYRVYPRSSWLRGFSRQHGAEQNQKVSISKSNLSEDPWDVRGIAYIDDLLKGRIFNNEHYTSSVDRFSNNLKKKRWNFFRKRINAVCKRVY